MISQLEKEIIFKFLKARKKDGFLNVISIFSFIGIGLGVAVLIIVMSVTPYDCAIIPMINKNDKSNLEKSIKVNEFLKSKNIETIIDDTDENISAKIKKFNLIGIPYQLIIGSKSEGNLYEFKEVDGETQKLKVEDIASQIIKAKQNWFHN